MYKVETRESQLKRYNQLPKRPRTQGSQDTMPRRGDLQRGPLKYGAKYRLIIYMTFPENMKKNGVSNTVVSYQSDSKTHHSQEHS